MTFAGTASATDPSTDTTVAPVTTKAPRTVDLVKVKARCDAAIDERQVKLDEMTKRVEGAKELTSAHRDALNSTNSTSKSGLADLKTKIDGDTDGATLKTDCESIYSGFRIFALRAPQMHLAITGDREGALITKGNTVETKLSAAIATAASKGKDVSDAQAKLTDLQAKLADATSQLNGVVDNLLTFTPAQWNANHDVLKASVASEKTVRDDVKAAFADAKAIVADLRS
jgi:hypothetical protein